MHRLAKLLLLWDFRSGSFVHAVFDGPVLLRYLLCSIGSALQRQSLRKGAGRLALFVSARNSVAVEPWIPSKV
jgi:hypothetical protein